MNRTKILFLLSLSILLSGYKPLKEINFTGVQYLRNYDGDTVTVNIFEVHPLLGREIGVRIKDIDTPEMVEGKKAVAAKSFLGDLLTKANQIDLIGCTRGKYFRIVCDIMVDGKSVSKLIQEAGYCTIYSPEVEREKTPVSSSNTPSNTSSSVK